ISEERLLAEFGALAELSGRVEPPAIAMYDGSLILWYLRKQPEGRRRDIVSAVTAWLGVCRDNGVIPIGYISKPGARDVVYDLALLACDREHAHCESCRAGRRRSDVPCPEIVKLHDADVFGETLEPGQRSAVFINRLTPVLDEYGAEDNRIAYFYFNVGAEIARVEFPRWVFDEGLVRTAQSLIFDQSDKGAGYPRVLTLAHEYALVERKEADAFLGLLEGVALPSTVSPKEFAKRRRRV
ncbi:MAG: DNA double-strand break repair nuclease NurA, partial [Candidatus Coatesbacteria bacterium]